MYEKYSGLPDTTRSTSQSGSRNGDNAGRGYPGEGKIEYYQAPVRSGSSSAKRSSARRAKARKRKLIMGIVSLLFVALLIVATVVLVRSCAGPAEVDLNNGHFRSNVYINWTNVSDMSADQARALLETNEQDTLNKIAIRLSADELNAIVSGADMNASSDLNDIIAQALAGGANQDYYSTISIDEEALKTRINEINSTASKPPVDASFTFEFSSSGKPTLKYIDGVPGFGLEVESTIALVKQAIESRNLQTTLTPTLTTIDPAVTIADIQAQVTQIGKFTTTYDYKGTAEDTEAQRAIIPNRAFNVEKAADKINGQVVEPGKTWSFNKVVGDRTEANGWKEANGIFGGDTLTLQYGGGVCQVSTTLYNALLQAYPYFRDGFDRTKHSWPSTYVEKGLDATVDTGHIDFAFTNNSQYKVYIFAYETDNKMAKSRKRDLTVVIYGEAFPEGTEYKTRTVLVSEEPPGTPIITESKNKFVGEDDTILAAARSKFVIDVYIDWYLNGVKQDEFFDHTDTYDGNPERRVVGIKPTPTPEPTPSPEVPPESP